MASLTEFAVPKKKKRILAVRKKKRMMEMGDPMPIARGGLDDVVSASTNPMDEMKMDESNFMGEMNVGVQGKRRGM